MLPIKLETVLAALLALVTTGVRAGIANSLEPGTMALSEGQEPKSKTAEKALGKEDREELESRIWALRHPHMFKIYSNDKYSLIGNLVENGWWKRQLPLGRAQADAIVKLDGLIRDANDNMGSVVADSLEKNPNGFRDTLARFERRIHESIYRGERVTALGLLTEPQAAYVLYAYTSNNDPYHVLHDQYVQELLGITAAQIQELKKVGDAANAREFQLNLWSVDPIEQEYVRTVMTANAKRMNAEALRVLTPAQQKIWDAFTARRTLAVNAPDLPAPTKEEMERTRIREKSAIFRMLAEKENTLKLTEAQKELVKRLEEIAQTGLHWISVRKSTATVDQVARTSSEFVRQSEQVALSCILTEQQAEQIKSAITKVEPETKPKNR